MMKKQLTLIIWACLSLVPLLSAGQAPVQQPVVKVSGEVKTPLNLTEADLQKMAPIKVNRKDHDGKAHTYTGVLLADILQKAGAAMGAELRGKNLAKYLLVEAADGYRAVFALPELDKAYTDRTIILAYRVDGNALSSAEGPFQVIVPDEKKHARCVRQVTAFRILTAQP